MDRVSVFSGSAFRTAVFAAVAVLATLTVAAVGAFYFVRQALEHEIAGQILAEQVMLREIYEKGGEAALIRTISEINNPVALSQRAIGAFGPGGLKLAGNIRTAPSITNFQRANLIIDGEGGRTRPYYVHTALFDRIVLVIGHDLSLVTATERRLALALIGSGLLAGAVILLIGYGASHRSLLKLSDLEATLDHVSQGDTAIRVPTGAGNDQIDRIARRVNVHLDRLSGLMVTTRSTVAAIAHDLKTPLSRAHLSLQSARTLIDEGEDPRGALEDTEAELERLGAIFDTVLRISRIETAANAVDFAPFDLAPLIADLAETFAPVAEERGQTLSFLQPETAVPPVSGDARMVRQMIVNLIQNAINHGPAGNAVEIALGAHDGACTLDVADHGPGIREDERAKVFDPFYRSDSSRTGDGSGLGLALVKAIAGRHGIAVELADNAPGLKVRLHFPPAA